MDSAKSLYLPAHGEWERRSAEPQGVNQQALDKAVQFALNNEIKWPLDTSKGNVGQDAPEWAAKLGPFKDRGGSAGIVVKGGYIIAEWGDVERVDLTFSATKSYLATLAGLAYDRGMIKSLRDAVISYETGKLILSVDTGDPVDGFDTDQNREITWEHLLHQTSEWEGTLFTKPDIVDWNRNLDPEGMGGSGDFSRPVRHSPGDHWEYNDVRVNRTALALLSVWGESLSDVLCREVMNPIGASDTWEWHGYGLYSEVDIDGEVIESVSGGAHWGGGLWISTLDHARFGLLYLNRGKWGGDQIISEQWIDMMTTPCEKNDQYGYMWWLNTGHKRYGKHASQSAFAASGAGGNCVVIDPEKDLVVVTRWCENVVGVVDLVARAVN